MPLSVDVLQSHSLLVSPATVVPAGLLLPLAGILFQCHQLPGMDEDKMALAPPLHCAKKFAS